MQLFNHDQRDFSLSPDGCESKAPGATVSSIFGRPWEKDVYLAQIPLYSLFKKENEPEDPITP